MEGTQETMTVEQRSAAGPDRRPATRSGEAGVDRVRHLQRHAGNQAVAQLLDDPQGRGRRPATRDDAMARADSAASRADDAMARANAAMDATRLGEERRKATGRILLAADAYGDACDDVRDSIRAAAKRDAEMMALILDVAMGFAMPVLAGAVARFANSLPVSAPLLAYRGALLALDRDQTKAVLGGATKVASQALKSNAPALAGETETDGFIVHLKHQAHVSFELLSDSLGSMDAVQVGVVSAAFHSSVANRFTYRREIKDLCDRYQRNVSPIGAVPLMSDGFAPATEAAWIADGASKKLALVVYMPGFLGLVGNRYVVTRWVDPSMEALALTKQRATYGSVQTIDPKDVVVMRP